MQHLNEGSINYMSTKILIVDDDPNICELLRLYFENEGYEVKTASDGAEGVSYFKMYEPDLVLLDIMLPKKDGWQVCREIREISSKPVIMVTAKTGTDDIKEGYAAGADEYITKPFDASILKIRVDNLIQSREKLKELYSKNFSLESLGVDVTSVDEKFMQKLYATLQQNIANSDLNLDAFCKELGLSKSNLYRKIKQITGYSPNEFIRNFRLETAAKMLKETDMSITEVYCAVGYNSLAYFSNSFKTLYGVSPSEFKNRSEGERE